MHKSSLAVAILLVGWTADFSFGQNIIENLFQEQCGCTRMLYKPEREAVRIKRLNKCLTKYANGKTFAGVEPLPEGCAATAIRGLVNLRAFASHMQSLEADERRNSDICYYTLMGYRKKDGSANVDKILKDIEDAVAEDPDVLPQGTLQKLLHKGRVECDPSEMKAFYKCVYSVCFRGVQFPDI